MPIQVHIPSKSGQPPVFCGYWTMTPEHVMAFRAWRATHPSHSRYELDLWMIDHHATFVKAGAAPDAALPPA